MDEMPSRGQALAGDGFYYDGEGNAMALCCGCMEPIDLQHDWHYEVSALRRKGVVREGPRWWGCEGCWEAADSLAKP